MYGNSFKYILHWTTEQLKGDNSNIWKYSTLLKLKESNANISQLTHEKVFNWFNICSVSLKSQFKRNQMAITYGVENLMLQVNTSTCSKMVLPFPLYMLRFWMTYFLRSGCMFLIWVSPGSFFIGYKFQKLKRFISYTLHSAHYLGTQIYIYMYLVTALKIEVKLAIFFIAS